MPPRLLGRCSCCGYGCGAWRLAELPRELRLELGIEIVGLRRVEARVEGRRDGVEGRAARRTRAAPHIAAHPSTGPLTAHLTAPLTELAPQLRLAQCSKSKIRQKKRVKYSSLPLALTIFYLGSVGFDGA